MLSTGFTPVREENVVSSFAVSVNCATDDELVKDRRADIAKPDTAGYLVDKDIGFQGDPVRFLNITVFDLLIAEKQKPRDDPAQICALMRGGPLTERPYVFASFNGMRVPGAKDPSVAKDYIEENYVMMGPAGESYVYENPNQNKSGVAAGINSSPTITNTGRRPIAPGQLLVWSAPVFTNPEETRAYLARQRKAESSLNNVRHGRLPPLVEPADYDSLFEMIFNKLLVLEQLGNAAGVQLSDTNAAVFRVACAATGVPATNYLTNQGKTTVTGIAAGVQAVTTDDNREKLLNGVENLVAVFEAFGSRVFARALSAAEPNGKLLISM